MTAADKKRALEQWKEHNKRVQSMTSTKALAPETGVQKEKRIKRLQNNYSEFCSYYFPHWLTLRDKVTGDILKTVNNAFFHNAAAKKVRDTPNLKGVFMWPRGHAKSTHFDVFIPLWLMFQPQRLINVMVVVGKSEDSAKCLLGDIQSELEYNQRIIADFGEQKNVGNWQDGEFVTQSEVAFFARGRGQSPRGLRYKENRPDYIVIDDLDDDELCRNEARVNQLTDWVKEALFGALDAGRGRFIMVGNLISKNSVLQRISRTAGVHLSKIVAIDKDGEPIWKEKWTREEAAEAAEFMGYRAWQKEMMHNPIMEGAVFKAAWIKYKKMLPLHQYESIVLYIDPSWKGTGKADYKACKVWARPKKGIKGTSPGERHHLRAFVRQCSFSEMVRWVYDYYESLPENVVCNIYMEANFMQDTILDEFTQEGNLRGYQLPLIPDTRKKPEKFARVEAISPLWERGFIYYNEEQKDDPDMVVGIEQTLAFEKGMRGHDDGPDADEGALWKLQKQVREENFEPRIGTRPSAKNSW
ncbi:MAG: hypothetical protein ACRCUJ_01720 [Phocaeicola sp.]